MENNKHQTRATSCTAEQQRIPQQNKWFRLGKAEEKPQRAETESEPENVSQRQRSAMLFGRDPSSATATDDVKAAKEDEGAKARKRKLETTFGIRLPEKDRPQRSTIASAFGLRSTN